MLITSCILYHIMNRLHTESSVQTPSFHVVIPCYNEEAYVGGLLTDLAEQSYKPGTVIVADCASKDATVAVAERYESLLPLKVIQSSAQSPAAARNSGVKVLQCPAEDYLVFVDADMRLPDGFLAKIREVSSDHPVDFISPAFRSDGKHRGDAFSIRQMNTYNRRMIANGKVAGIGGVMIVRKAIHDSVGGFPEDVAQDDMGYVARLTAAGATAYYAGDAYAINSSRRLRQEGTLKWLLSMLPEHSRATTLLSRILRKDVTKKEYGHYR